MSLPSLVLPPWAKYAAAAALLAALWGHGWLTGARSVREDWEAATARLEARALADVQRLAQEAAQVEVVWVNTTSTIRENAKTLTREVTKYVSAEADARCPVPAGLVRLWNADLQTGLYEPASGGHDAPAGLALSEFAEQGIIEAKSRFELNRAALVACQAWAHAVEASR